MKFWKLLQLTFCLAFLAGCTPSVSSRKAPVVENKVLAAAELAKEGKIAGVITLTHRKLSIDEIANHLDMDEETARAHLRATNVHGYFSLLAQNYPPGEEFTLYYIDLRRQINPTKTFFVNSKGLLVTPLDDDFVNLQNNYLFFSNYLPGEPADFVLGSKNEKYFAATRIIPNPITCEDDAGHNISVSMDSADKRQYLIHCRGLEPFEAFMLVTQFENEKLAHAVNADENGEVLQTAGPTVPWATGGDASIELRGNSLSHPLFVNFKWGE